MVLRVVYFIMQVISITNLLYGLCEAEFTMTKYAADRISSLSTPRRLIVELGNGSSGPTRSVPTFTSSAVPEYGDRISEVIAQLLFVLKNYLSQELLLKLTLLVIRGRMQNTVVR